MANRETWDMSLYNDPGLYLIFDNSDCLALTRKNIEKIAHAYWNEPDKIPENIKKSIYFKRCSFCPLKHADDICDALRPILPLLESIDTFNSYDDVTTIYKSDEDGLYHISKTTMQRALRYISNLSLMSYCRIGRKYSKYFFGINPVEETISIVNRIYLNIYWCHAGDSEIVEKLIHRMKQQITTTTHNQLNRLKLICKNDAFMNAFVLTHLITDMLYDYKDAKLKEQLDICEGQGNCLP